MKSYTIHDSIGVSSPYAEIVAWRLRKIVPITAFGFKIDNPWNVVLQNSHSFDS